MGGKVCIKKEIRREGWNGWKGKGEDKNWWRKKKERGREGQEESLKWWRKKSEPSERDTSQKYKAWGKISVFMFDSWNSTSSLSRWPWKKGYTGKKHWVRIVLCLITILFIWLIFKAPLPLLLLPQTVTFPVGFLG